MNDFIADALNGSDTINYTGIDTIYKELRCVTGKLSLLDLGAGSLTENEQLRKVSQIVRHSSVSRKYGRLLSRIVRWLNPSTIIELGSGTGFSTMYMALTGDHCRIYSVEGCPEIAGLARRNINKLGLENTEIITGPFNEILPSLLQYIQHPLFVFIDGDHRGEHLIDYLETIMPFTAENTVFVLDDIHWSASMEEAWEKIINREEVSVSIDLFRMGILFMKKDINKQHFIIKF